MKYLYQMISWVFHPLLVATLTTCILVFKAPELLGNLHSAAIPYFISAVFLTTALIPGFCIWAMKNFRLISDLELVIRKERFFPFLIIVAFYATAFYMFKSRGANEAFTSILLVVTSLVALLLVITQWFKISIHATAIWGSAGILCALSIARGVDLGNLLYVSIFAAGLTSTSRLYLGYHKPSEIWTGSILGFIYCFLSIMFI